MRCKYTPDDIIKYSTGALDHKKMDEISQHLEQCIRCRSRYTSLLLSRGEIPRTLPKKPEKITFRSILSDSASTFKPLLMVLILCFAVYLGFQYRQAAINSAVNHAKTDKDPSGAESEAPSSLTLIEGFLPPSAIVRAEPSESSEQVFITEQRVKILGYRGTGDDENIPEGWVYVTDMSNSFKGWVREEKILEKKNMGLSQSP